MNSASALRQFRLGVWLVDSSLDEIRAGDTLHKLEPRTMRLLCVLAERPGEVWSADELLGRVWPGVMVTQSSVYQAIAQLRRVLGDVGDEARYIATVPRKGYRLVATPLPIEPVTAPMPAPVTSPEIDAGGRADLRRRAEDRVLPRNRRNAWRLAGVIGVAALALALVWSLARKPAAAELKPAIAVLPFADLSSDGSYQTFCDGISEELLNALARVPGLRVTGRNSSFQFRGGAIDMPTIGARLGVTHVVEGSVRHSAGRIRVAAQLIDAKNGFQVWSNTFDRPRGDALTIQTEISRAVVTALELRLSADAQHELANRPQPLVNAYDLYLLGRHQQLERTPEALRRAIAYQQQAIAADPKFALAHAGLADAYMAEHFSVNRQISKTAELVQPEIDAALRLDPELAEGYSAWSVLLVELKRPGEAIAKLKRAIAINSNYAEAYLRLGYAYENDGQLSAALESYDQVAVLDPLNTILHVRRCLLLQGLGKFDSAQGACARGFELQPNLPNALWAFALLELARGDLAAAVVNYQAALKRTPQRADIRSELAMVYLDLGMKDEAAREITAVRAAFPRSYVDLIEARSFLARGDSEGAKRFVKAIKIPDGYYREFADAGWLALAAGDEALARRWSPLEPPTVGEAEDDMMPSVYDTRWSLCSMCARALLERVQGDTGSALRHERRMFKWLEGFEKQGGQWSGLHYLKGTLHAQSGDAEAAFKELGRAIDLGWRRPWLLRADPALKSIRDDARFAPLLKKVEDDAADARRRIKEPGSNSAVRRDTRSRGGTSPSSSAG